MPGHYSHSASASAYQAVGFIINFLVSTVGWEVVQDVTNSSPVRDVVLLSPGELEVPNGFPIYIRLQSTTDRIFLFTYETFTNVSINTGEVTDVTYGAVYTTSNAQGFELRVVADLERVIINIALYTGTNSYTGYVGRITSYHRANEHSHPNIVKGTTSVGYDWYSSINNSWMLGPTGAKQHYYAIKPLSDAALLAVSGSARNGDISLAALVLVNTDADPQKSELVGEPRGLYHLSRHVSQTDHFLNINGDIYVVFVQNNIPLAAGPVVTGIPLL